MSKYAGLCVYLCVLLGITTGSYYENQQELLDELFKGSRYTTLFIPQTEFNRSLEISVDISLGNYIEVYESTQSVQVDLWTEFSWYDYLLTWNSSEHDNIMRVRLPSDKVWHPEVNVKFSTTHKSLVDKAAQVYINHDGLVTARISTNINFRCGLLVTKFPFDQQDCQFFFEISNADLHEAHFNDSKVSVKTVGRAEWAFVSADASPVTDYTKSNVNVTLSVRRRPSYYIIFIMIPIIATAELNPLVFLIPSDSGEKVSTAVTILLSYSVFLSVISDVLPQTSSSTSILSLYIVFSQIMSGFYVLVCVMIVRKYIRLEKCFLCPFACKKNSVQAIGKKNNEEKAPPVSHLDRVCTCVAMFMMTTLSVFVVGYIMF